MKNFLNFILFFLATYCFGQNHSIEIGENFDKIEFGYSTLSDVRSEYQNFELNETKTLNCPHTDDCDSSYGFNTSIEIPSNGIIFQTDYKTEQLIKKIFLYKPFKGELNNLLKIDLDSTTVKEVFEKFPNLKLTSTNRKKYWIIKNENITFLVNRFDNDNEYPIEPTEIYNRKIHSIILTEKRKPYESNDCKKPLFAPKTESHKNCLVKQHKGGIYYISWGDEPTHEYVKNGFWKEFYPNHKIKEQGNYIKGVKVGTFEYFTQNGKFTYTKNHFGGYFKLHKWKIIFGVIFIIIIILRIKRKKTTANTV
tara:strand:+ start:1567 stop:2493 length:927 start_codon:yes stop_codon:yes gene_type:complete